jgi:D-glycero-D-manno-heptose 1,7-bisphosphate phosphatase
MSGVVILDRDGVINADSADYIKSPAEWRPLPGAIEAIRRLTDSGNNIYIATNQAGVARGIFSAADLAAISRIFACLHHPDAGCDCRKPNPGMLLKIAAETGRALTGVPFVGDSLKDMDAARAAGCTPILVLTGNGATTLRTLKTADYPGLAVFDNLLAFAMFHIANASNESS